MDADLFSLDTVVESLRASGDAERLREAILDLAGLYAEIRHSPAPFVAGVSPVPGVGQGVRTTQRICARWSIRPWTSG